MNDFTTIENLINDIKARPGMDSFITKAEIGAYLEYLTSGIQNIKSNEALPNIIAKLHE